MNESGKVSLWRVIQVDYLAYMLFVSPLVVWALYLIVNLLGNAPKGGGSVYLFLGVVVTVFGWAGLALRFLRQKKLLTEGVEVQGQITRIFFYRDRGRVDVAYPFEGKEYEAWNSLHRSKPTDVMVLGETVAVRIDPRKPSRAVVSEPYEEDGL